MRHGVLVFAIEHQTLVFGVVGGAVAMLLLPVYSRMYEVLQRLRGLERAKLIRFRPMFGACKSCGGNTIEWAVVRNGEAIETDDGFDISACALYCSTCVRDLGIYRQTAGATK